MHFVPANTHTAKHYPFRKLCSKTNGQYLNYVRMFKTTHSNNVTTTKNSNEEIMPINNPT